MGTTIQSGCNAPESFKNPGRPVFLEAVAPGKPLGLNTLRTQWIGKQAGGYWTFATHFGFLSVNGAGTVIDTFSVDDGSGRQRWVLEPVPNEKDVFYMKVSGGMDAGAPTYLARAGLLKTKLVAKPSTQCRWIILGLSSPSPAPAAPAPAAPAGPLAPRDVLLQKRGHPLKTLVESAQFCIWAAQGADTTLMQRVVTYVESVWNTYIQKLKFAVKADVAQGQEWGVYKKPLYLAGSSPPGPCDGCPESGHGYEYQAWTDQGKAYLVTGGCGAEGGCVAHELAHLMQAATGSFGWGGNCPWAFESSAQYMRFIGCPAEEDAESLKPWLQYHMTSIQKHDGSPECHQYGSWLWWIWLDRQFGWGTVGKIWNEARAPEDPMHTASRICGVPAPDLFARWVASLLSNSAFYNDGERWTRINAHVGHAAGWSTFDPLLCDGAKYTPAPAQFSLEKYGFHALRLSDAKPRGPKKVRLDAAAPGDWRMVVVSNGKDIISILKPGEISPPVPLAKTTLGICIAGDGPLPPNGQAYAVSILD